MSERYIGDCLDKKDVLTFIDGFTPEKYLRFLGVYLLRYPEGLPTEEIFREDLRLMISGEDLPEDITSLPSPLPQLLNGYEMLTEPAMREFIELEIFPYTEGGDIKFIVDIMVPSEDVDMDNQDYEPSSFISLQMLVERRGWTIPNLPPNSINNYMVEISSSDAIRLFNILANEEVPITNWEGNETIYFTSDVQRVKSVRVGR